MGHTFSTLKTVFSWRPLRNCPGRYGLCGPPSRLLPGSLAGGSTRSRTFRATVSGDEVVVTPLVDGGLISYRKANGTYRHTLNDQDGFRRKLTALGVEAETEEGT